MERYNWTDFEIPTRYSNATFKDVEGNVSDSKIDDIKKWVAGDCKGNSLYLYSENPGTGKTILGVLALKGKIESGNCSGKALFVDAHKLSYYIKYEYEEASALITKMLQSSVLLIDDIDIIPITDTKVIEKLSLVISDFYNYSEKSLIITSNSDISKTDKFLGKRNFSRLFEMCYFLDLSSADDYRQR